MIVVLLVIACAIAMMVMIVFSVIKDSDTIFGRGKEPLLKLADFTEQSGDMSR